MDKITMRAVIVAALALLVLTPQATHAQASLQATQLLIGAPAQSSVGAPITVQAVLADSQGHPISKEVIYFTTQAKFLNDTSDVVLAQAITNSKGQASAQFNYDFPGTVSLQAEFRGDSEYAPSNAATQVSATDSRQVYADHIGVDIPGFNVPPVMAPRAAIGVSQGITAFVQNLWPAMNGWPVMAVLFLVWATYLFALTFVFRLAAQGGEADTATSTGERRSM